MDTVNPYSSPSACDLPCHEWRLRRAVVLSVSYALSMHISCALIERLITGDSNRFTEALFNPTILVPVLASLFFYLAFGASVFPDLWRQPVLRHMLAGVATSLLFAFDLLFATRYLINVRRYSELVPEPYGRFLLFSLAALVAVSGIVMIWKCTSKLMDSRLSRSA